MSHSTRRTNLQCNAADLLNVIYPEYGTIKCVGTAVSYGRRCRNPINMQNCATARSLLRELSSSTIDLNLLGGQLQRLAGILCCVRNHQGQANEIASRWKRLILEELERPTNRTSEPQPRPSAARGRAAPARPDNGDLEAEVRRLRRQVDELLRRQEQTAPHQHRQPRESQQRSTNGQDDTDRQRQRTGEDRSRSSTFDGDREQEQSESQRHQENDREEARREDTRQAEERQQEARRQAQRDREQQQADARRRAEREQAHQRRQEAQRRREEQARDREEQERRSWEESCTRYNRDWSNMSRIDSLNLDEDVRDSIPWPVKDGRWQDISEGNVVDFLRHAPNNVHGDPSSFVRFLMGQARKWHPDAVGRAFPGLIGNVEVNRLVTLVMQVINAEIGRARQRIMVV